MKAFKRFLIFISIISAIVASLVFFADFFADKMIGVKRFITRFAGIKSAGYLVNSEDGIDTVFMSNHLAPDFSYFLTAILGMLSVITGAIAFVIHSFSKEN